MTYLIKKLKSDWWVNYFVAGSIILAICLMIFTYGWQDTKDKESINEFVQARGEQVTYLDKYYTVIGTPYYYVNKGGRIWEVRTNNGKTYWIRKGNVFSDDVIEQ